MSGIWRHASKYNLLRKCEKVPGDVIFPKASGKSKIGGRASWYGLNEYRKAMWGGISPFLKKPSVCLCCYLRALRSDPGQGQIIVAAAVWVSLGMVSECPKWLDLKQILGTAWGKARNNSSIYIYISLESSTASRGLGPSHSLCNLTPLLSNVPHTLALLYRAC